MHERSLATFCCADFMLKLNPVSCSRANCSKDTLFLKQELVAQDVKTVLNAYEYLKMILNK